MAFLASTSTALFHFLPQAIIHFEVYEVQSELDILLRDAILHEQISFSL